MRFLLILLIFSSSLILKEKLVQHSTSVELKTGEEAIIGGLVIKFKEVLSDSRCPKEVTCIWAGEAKVLVALYRDDRLLGEEILTFANEFSNVSRLENYKSEMDSLVGGSLKPYPKIGQKTIMEDYSLSLQFYRKELN